jgi:hypothetical protein
MCRSVPTLPVAALAAMCCITTACSKRSTPTAIAPIVLDSGGTRTGATVWDFAGLAGGDGPQGSPTIFTIAGEGAIIASVYAKESNPGFQVWSKGFNDPPLSYERGLGVCGNYGTGGNCGNASPAGEDEIGDVFPDSAGNLTVVPSLYLNFTGLAAGLVVDSVTLGSLQIGEGYSISSSTDGTTYTLMVAGARTTGTSDILAFAVPAATRYLRFDQGPGGAGNNYIVETVLVTLPKP